MASSANLRLRFYAATTFLVAALSLLASMRALPFTVTPALVAFVAVAMAADVLTVQLATVSVSITYPVLSAAIILFGPSVAGLVAALSTIPSALMVRDKPFVRGFFNAGQAALICLTAGWVYLAAGGKLIAGMPLRAADIPRLILPLTLLAVVSFLVNTTLVAFAVTLNTGVPFVQVWRSSFAWTIPTQASLTLLALALSQVVASENVIGLGLFAVPLLISRQFYERYIALKQAYAETVRSLVAVIEAKDAYTKGHSERVAEYSVAVAKRLGFSDDRIERLELAALLHDLGKVGVSREILSKPGVLDESEFEQIKTHPEVGARIIESVPFLADLVPVIAKHHERMDGTGYGNQLPAEEIPLEARVLSVADAFDAMTSSRPYRSALSNRDTINDLRRCAGTQFDPVIVETFIESLADSGAIDETEPIDEAV